MVFERSFNDGPEGLVSLMKGQDTLSGWDVLVSYSVVQLNALLAERAASLKINAPNTWEAVSTDLLGLTPDRTLVFDVHLLQPTLQFVDTTNAVTLTFGLAGSFRVKETGPSAKPVPLPSGLTCQLATSLVNVPGQWLDQGWKPAAIAGKDASSSPNNFVTALEPGASMARGICVDLTSCTATLSQAPGAGIAGSTIATLKPLMASFLEQHFADYGFKLCLAAVANHYDVSSQTSYLLQPTQFCFTVAGGVLMTWIGLKGGPNTGTRASAQTALSFAPGGRAVSPIPAGSTASIIFSSNTMANLFLKPAIEACPSVDTKNKVTCTSVKTQAGLTFEFTLKSSAINVPAEEHSSRNETYHVDGCSVDLNETPITLSVHCQDDGSAAAITQAKPPAFQPLQLAWTSSAKRITSRYHYTPDDYERSPTKHSTSGTVTFHYGGRGAWTASSDPIHHPNQLGVAWALDLQLTTSVTADKPTFWEAFGGKTGDIPSKYKDLTVPAPALNLTLKPLDYFLTTNLLLPGQHVFHADAPATDSKTSGLAAPRDVILTGRVAPNSSTANKASQALEAHRLTLAANTAAQAPANMFLYQEMAYMVPANRPRVQEYVPEKTLTDFKNAMLGFPASNLLGDYLQMLEAADATAAQPSLPVRDLLDKYGFGHLAETNLLALWGTSLDELFGGDDDGQGGTATDTATDTSVSWLDLRTYAGYYIVAQPADDEGEQFLVHPVTGAIRMRGRDVVSVQSYDAENKRVVVTWQMAAGPTTTTYATSFRVVADKERFVVGIQCAGTVCEDGGKPQPFEAYSKGYRKEVLEVQEAEVLAVASVVEDSAEASAAKDLPSDVVAPLEVKFSMQVTESNSNSGAENASLYLGIVLTCASIVSYGVGIAVYCWKTKNYKAETQLQATTIKEQKAEIDGMHKVMESVAEKATRAEYAHHQAAVDLALADLERRVDHAAEVRLASIVADRPTAFADIVADPAYRTEVRNHLADAARDALKAEAPSALRGVTQLVIEGAMARDPYRNALTPERYKTIVETIQQHEYDRAVERLEDRPRPDALAFSELAGQKILDTARVEATRVVHDTANHALHNANLALQQVETKRKVHQEALTKAREAEKKEKSQKNKEAVQEAESKLKAVEAEHKVEHEKREKARVEEHHARKHHTTYVEEARRSEHHQREKRRHVLVP